MRILLALATFAGCASAAPIDEDYANRLCLAIFHAEGGTRAKRPYGVLSVPVRDAAHARAICLRTIKSSWNWFEAAGCRGCFVEFLGKKYAPIGAANDPSGLNVNWVRNVKGRLSTRERDFSL